MEIANEKRTSPPGKDDPIVLPKEKIFRHALSYFMEAGFARVSIDELTTELGISKKTFYKCFTGKEDLLCYIIERILQDVATTIQRIVEDDTSFVTKLDHLMAFLGMQVRRLSKPLIHDMQRFAPEVWERVQEFRRERILTHFGRLVELGQQSGYVRPDVNTRIFLLAYLAAVEDIMNPSVLANESFSAEDALRNIVAVFFNGILSEEARREFAILQQTSHV